MQYLGSLLSRSNEYATHRRSYSFRSVFFAGFVGITSIYVSKVLYDRLTKKDLSDDNDYINENQGEFSAPFHTDAKLLRDYDNMLRKKEEKKRIEKTKFRKEILKKKMKLQKEKMDYIEHKTMKALEQLKFVRRTSKNKNKIEEYERFLMGKILVDLISIDYDKNGFFLRIDLNGMNVHQARLSFSTIYSLMLIQPEYNFVRLNVNQNCDSTNRLKKLVMRKCRNEDIPCFEIENHEGLLVKHGLLMVLRKPEKEEKKYERDHGENLQIRKRTMSY